MVQGANQLMENRSYNGQPNIGRLRATNSPQKFLNDEGFGRIVYTGYFVYITNSAEIRRYVADANFRTLRKKMKRAKEAQVKGSEGEAESK